MTFVRRAIAVVVLGYYVFLFAYLAMYFNPIVTKAMWALATLYGVGVVAVLRGWFWGRWYARGLGYWGVVVAVMSMWQMGAVHEYFVFLAVTNGAVALLLAGETMAARFEGRDDWRARFHLDDNGVERLGKSVTRAGMSLPWLLLYLLLPRPEGAALLAGPGELALYAGASAGWVTAAALAATAVAVAGLVALLRDRAWGLVALATAAGLVLVPAALAPTAAAFTGVLAGASLVAAVAPFARALTSRLAR